MEEKTLTTAQSIEAVISAELKEQFAEAKNNPRDIEDVLDKIVNIATFSTDVAASCIYAIPSSGKIVLGWSVRLAEIVASQWKNVRASVRVISRDGKEITVQGTIMDLETNSSVSVDVTKSIIDRNGKTVSFDQQQLIANACKAIAFRNSVYKMVPSVLFNSVVDEIKKRAIGSESEAEEYLEETLQDLKTKGIAKEDVAKALSASSQGDLITRTLVLKGIMNAIKEGELTYLEAFGKHQRSRASRIGSGIEEYSQLEEFSAIF